MKNPFIFLFLFVLFSLHVLAATGPQNPPPIKEIKWVNTTVMLEWDPGDDNSIDHYVVHWGTNSSLKPIVYADPSGLTQTNFFNDGGGYVWRINSGKNVMQMVTNLQHGIRYYFAVRSLNGVGQESRFSKEISYLPAHRPVAPDDHRISQTPVFVIDILFSNVIGEWETNASVKWLLPMNKRYQFFKSSGRMEYMDTLIIK